MANEYDLVVLGGGTAGYVSAIRASQLGMKVAIVEKEKLGGTCLHKGCIPTKSLLKSAEVFSYIKQAAKYGIQAQTPAYDFKDIRNRKDEVVAKMYGGVQHLMKANHIDVYSGTGRILGPSIFSPQAGTVSVENSSGESELLVNKHVLICTGSTPRELPFLPFDHKTVLSSDDMMTLETLPKSMAIVGGGVIGLEFASLLADLEVEVTVIEAGSSIIPAEEKKISRILQKELEKKGIKFLTGESLSAETIVQDEQGITFTLSEVVNAEQVLVAIGRRPNSDDIGLNNTKIKATNGFIEVNEFYQTEDKHIYAVGDVIGNLQLAHVATKEGVIAVEHMNDAAPITLDYDTVPKCIYTNPEVASIGMTEAAAKDAGFDTVTKAVPFAAIGKAVINGDTSGQAILIKDKKSDEVLGLSMIGPNVTEIINEVALAKFMNASTLELGLTVHAHPSVSEVLMELGLAGEGRAIHI
ncbi:dihydrolipoyl dehydrogenase [Macrococcus equipercicus]|uniref:Dihydrolipoyl dehydrogenase n=1 Tax=Macrococcus equipercicus TaxID=69967 RepID=A0A9Q9F0J4_9STAP|nr:dihydrolipoyl dehydrogenase [Macrococcus equipercicus]KAA1040140.1 dihydrolipoyl dehydrogenase [Macrococcus equipercicus]UTH12912.1 dihydrolipoyl dehydrogenase [Macrococcus equipercicus]